MTAIRDALARRWRSMRRLAQNAYTKWLAVLVLLFCATYFFPASPRVELADRLRWLGMFYQIVGLTTVLWCLDSSLRQFGTSLWEALWPIKRSSSGAFHAEGGLDASFISGIVAPSTGGSTEERIARLERNVVQLDKHLSNLALSLVKHRHESAKRHDTERTEREAEFRKIRDELKQATIGNVRLEVFGLAVLFVGIALTAIPTEIACLLGRAGL